MIRLWPPTCPPTPRCPRSRLLHKLTQLGLHKSLAGSLARPVTGLQRVETSSDRGLLTAALVSSKHSRCPHSYWQSFKPKAKPRLHHKLPLGTNPSLLDGCWETGEEASPDLKGERLGEKTSWIVLVRKSRHRSTRAAKWCVLVGGRKMAQGQRWGNSWRVVSVRPKAPPWWQMAPGTSYDGKCANLLRYIVQKLISGL